MRATFGRSDDGSSGPCALLLGSRLPICLSVPKDYGQGQAVMSRRFFEMDKDECQVMQRPRA